MLNIKDARAEIVAEDHESRPFLVSSSGFYNESVPTLIVGNVTGQSLVAPSAGHRLTIKGITLLGSGNQGDVKLKRSSDGTVILPGYFSAQSRANTSAALNIKLGIDEFVYVDTDSRGATDETFIGISYIEMKG